MTPASLALWERAILATYELTWQSSSASDDRPIEWEFDAQLVLQYLAGGDQQHTARATVTITKTNKDTLGQSPRVDGGVFLIRFGAAGEVEEVAREGPGTNLSAWFFDLAVGCSLPSNHLVKPGATWNQDPSLRWRAWKGTPTDASIGQVRWTLDKIDSTRGSLHSQWNRPAPHEVAEEAWIEWHCGAGIVASKRVKVKYRYLDARESSSGDSIYSVETKLLRADH
jgi:hypothetical protein